MYNSVALSTLIRLCTPPQSSSRTIKCKPGSVQTSAPKRALPTAFPIYTLPTAQVRPFGVLHDSFLSLHNSFLSLPPVSSTFEVPYLDSTLCLPPLLP